MLTWADLIQLAVLGLSAVSLVYVARDAAIRKSDLWWRVVEGLGLRHFGRGSVQAVTVLAIVLVLLRVPYLDIGWWSLLGGTGNIAIGRSSLPGAFFQAIVPATFLTVLIASLPILTHWEEEWFRLGAEEWSWLRRARSCVEFGLIHLVAGIPVGGALALMVSGGFLMYTYLDVHEETSRERVSLQDAEEKATMEAARVHTAYNTLLLGFALVYFVAKGVLYL